MYSGAFLKNFTPTTRSVVTNYWGGHYTRLMLLYQYFKAVILTLFALYGVL